MDRLSMLQNMVRQRPEEPFPKYGLAMELAKLEDRAAEATAAFENLIQAHPDYVAAYLMAGNHFAKQGDPAKARATYERGVEVAKAAGDDHTVGELEVALNDLG